MYDKDSLTRKQFTCKYKQKKYVVLLNIIG